ncbi:lebercilin isoform X1 [Monodelphis domestica]|uniref:lebercilin isoform X1 n=1 Tax=Monodelphis domestica TaxID=13616 RepID=UPI0024E1BA9F|nr:lebercilin isoform X1 [Monodelphis domestica]
MVPPPVSSAGIVTNRKEQSLVAPNENRRSGTIGWGCLAVKTGPPPPLPWSPSRSPRSLCPRPRPRPLLGVQTQRNLATAAHSLPRTLPGRDSPAALGRPPIGGLTRRSRAGRIQNIEKGGEDGPELGHFWRKGSVKLCEYRLYIKTMGERSRISDINQDGYSEQEQYSDTFYSDDFENSFASTQSSIQKAYHNSPVRKKGPKIYSSDSHHQVSRRTSSKFPPNRREFRLGHRSQSLNREPSQKDIDLLTKRVLTARLLKISELQNEVTELQFKLDELQKENKALKRLQYKQEKALNKFEDTENEISQLIVRHNNEIRALKERLRKSQEKERATDKKVKDTECELYRTKCSLKKLKKLSEAKHLPERDDLAKKLVLAETKLDDTEKKIKELSKNLQLNASSFQRQLNVEKRRAHEVQDENKILQREVQQLNQKLREKEKELDAKNIYSNRMVRKTPKKDRDASPRKNAVSSSVKGVHSTKGVQTIEYYREEELLSSLTFDSQDSLRPEEDHFATQEQKSPKKDEETPEIIITEREEKHLEEDELCVTREETETCQDDGARENFECQTAGVVLIEEEEPIAETAVCPIENENSEKSEQEEEQKQEQQEQEQQEQQEQNEGERLKKEMLIAKLNEIDKEIHTSLNLKGSHSKSVSPEEKSQSFRFSESTERLFTGFFSQDSNHKSPNNADQKQRNIWSPIPVTDFTFGSYVPSFGKTSGRSNVYNQKSGILDLPKSNQDGGDLITKKEKKSNLMEQLFGANASASSSLTNIKGDFDPLNVLPRDKGSREKGQDEDDDFLLSEENFNPNRHRLKHTNNRPAVKAVDSLEDEVEEVVLR